MTEPASPPRGTLYVVATPIGNLEDLSARAVRVLGSVDLIACEDTRTTRPLLTRQGLSTRLVSHHKFNEPRSAAEILTMILAPFLCVVPERRGTGASLFPARRPWAP